MPVPEHSYIARISSAIHLRLLAILLMCFQADAAWAQFDHSPWDELLRSNVIVLDRGQATQVDYDAMAADRARLRAYLDAIAAVARPDFESWSEPEQLAFLINTYNAWTVELILTRYPDLDSIRDFGFLFNTAWRRDIVSLFGEQVSLDDVEHGMIRGWERYKEPRIHFAANCAAIGCPALRAEAYTGESLERQLDENTRLFLSDHSRNYFSEGRLYLSSIFNWYEEDFEQGWQGIDSVSEFLLDYVEELQLDDDQIEALRSENLPIRFLRYDWDLNRT